MPEQHRFNTGPGGSLDLENIFSYHPPFGDQVTRYGDLRDQGWELARMIEGHCPPSSERSTALSKVREAIFWANASIACNEKNSDDPQRVHWARDGAMVHAVVDVEHARATTDPAKVTCEVCQRFMPKAAD